MATGHLNKTFSGAGNTKTATQSFWIKRGNISANMMAGITVTGGGSYYGIQFLTDDVLDIYLYNSGSAWEGRLKTNRKFRDTNAWYHFVLAWDTTQSSSSDRLKFYVNGVQETSFSIATYPNQNQDLLFNTATGHQINAAGGGNWDGQMAHFHYVDGTAYTPSTFGETDATTGIWKPKPAPSVTYGTNGFFLKFDNSANMGLDSSGQSNNWTTSGTIIQNKDTPSNVFATLNPLARRLTSNDPTYLNGNTTLQGQTVNGQNNNGLATLGDLAKGKYYFECKIQTIGDNCGVGIVDTPDPSNGIPEGSHEIFYSNDGNKWNGSGYASYGATYTTGDIIGCAFDVTAGTISFYKNGVSQGTAATDLASSLNYGYTPMGYTNKGVMNFNFGNGYFGTTAVSSAQNPTDGIGIFEYTPPTNYRAVCTKSINAQEYS